MDAIRRDQAHRVRSIVAYAYRCVPYYRETMKRLGLRPSDFCGAGDLARLPILERDQLQRDPEYFVSELVSPHDWLRLRSGGSSGERCSVHHDVREIYQNAAHGERHRSLVTPLLGKRFGYREAVIASPHGCDFKVQNFCQEKGLFPGALRIERQYLSVLDSPEKVLRSLNAFQPDIIHSYGSYLGILFGYVHTTHANFHLPKVVTYSSDVMPDGVRHLIEREFKLPVFSTYEAIEAFKIGFECEQHRGLHLNLDLYPLRVVDGNGFTLSTGESGEVIVSNLINRATVLLNYRLGDIAALLPDPCPCGRSLPLLSYVQGRGDDLIELDSGETIHPEAVRLIFCTDQEPIWQYQVVQRSGTHFSVKIFAARTCDQAAARARISEAFTSKFGQRITTDIAFVDSIMRTASGKVRPVIAARQSLSRDGSMAGGKEGC